MTYEEFRNRIEKDCLYETIYTDNVGRDILVIRLLDAFEAFKPREEWVILKSVLEFIDEFIGAEESRHPMFSEGYDLALFHAKEFIEARIKEIKEKNT